MPGGMNQANMMQQIQKMQQDMANAQQELETETVEVSVGGGAITIVITGHQRVQNITINPEAVDLEDEEWLADLQDLLIAAVNQAIEQSQAMAAEKIKVGGILVKRDLALIGIMSVPDHVDLAGAVFEALGDRGVNCVLVVQSVVAGGRSSIVFAVSRPSLPRALETLNGIQARIAAKETVIHSEVGSVSVFGPHFGERPGISGAMFAALGAAGIRIHAISTSISSLSCVVDEDELADAVQALEQAFQLPNSS